MSRGHAISGVAIVALTAMVFAYTAINETKNQPVVDATDCDSCAARKQSLKKVHQALSPTETPAE